MATKGQVFQKYDLAFKIELVERYLRGEVGGVKRAAREAGLKSSTQLRNWIKKYQAGELTEAAVDQRGRSGGGNKHRHPRTRFESTEDEIAYLRLENEYLKKKLLTQGEPESSIASLWSSKNPK